MRRSLTLAVLTALALSAPALADAGPAQLQAATAVLEMPHALVAHAATLSHARELAAPAVQLASLDAVPTLRTSRAPVLALAQVVPEQPLDIQLPDGSPGWAKLLVGILAVLVPLGLRWYQDTQRHRAADSQRELSEVRSIAARIFWLGEDVRRLRPGMVGSIISFALSEFDKALGAAGIPMREEYRQEAKRVFAALNAQKHATDVAAGVKGALATGSAPGKNVVRPEVHSVDPLTPPAG